MDPFIGAHDSLAFSTDVLAPFIPGGHSAYRRVTEWYWKDLRGNIHESSVYLGSVVLMLAGVGVARRGAATKGDAWFWPATAVLFGVLSLGPALTYRGRLLTGQWMPYAWLEWALPPLRMSGVPVRMMMIVSLAVSVLAAEGLAAVLRRRALARIAAATLLIAALPVDLWPAPMTLARPDVPRWVYVLREEPDTAGLLDLSGTEPPVALYYQTIHQKPMAFG